MLTNKATFHENLNLWNVINRDGFFISGKRSKKEYGLPVPIYKCLYYSETISRKKNNQKMSIVIGMSYFNI